MKSEKHLVPWFVLGVGLLVTVMIATTLMAANGKQASVGASKNVDVVFSYQPGGNMGMPAVSNLPIRLDMMAIDRNEGRSVGHVDFSITVKDPGGKVVYANGPVHEHEGVHEVMLGPLPEGTYKVFLTAEPTMDTSKSQMFDPVKKEFSFKTTPLDLSGEVRSSLTLPDTVRAGEPTVLAIDIRGHDGKPVIHTDNSLVIQRDGLVVYQATNTHVHMGHQELTYTFPEAGDYTVTLSSSPTPMRASVNFPPASTRLTVKVK